MLKFAKLCQVKQKWWVCEGLVEFGPHLEVIVFFCPEPLVELQPKQICVFILQLTNDLAIIV